MSQCTTDWIFMLDADETLAPECQGMVRQAIEQAPEDCGEILPLMIMKAGPETMQHYCQKIFRRGWGKWKYPSHNVYVLQKGVAIHNPNLKIIHNRERRGDQRQRERAQQRNTMNEANFRRLVAEDPNDLRAVWYLALTLAEAGKLEESIPWWERYITKSQWSEEIYEARLELADVLVQLGRTNEAVEHLILAYKDEPRRAEAAMILGDMYFAGQAYARAEFWYRVATMIEDPIQSRCRLFMRPSCYGIHPWLRLARLYFQLRDATREEMAIQAAYQCAQTDAEIEMVQNWKRMQRSANINTTEYWDAIYAKGRDIGAAHRRMLQEVANKAGSGENRLAMDFGAGTGELIDFLRDAGWDAWGVDFSRVAAESHPRIALGDVTTYRTICPFDLVVSVSTLEHLDAPHELIQNMVQNVKPGGTVIVATPQYYGLVACPEHLHEFTHDDLHQLLTSYGVDKIEIEDYDAWTIAKGIRSDECTDTEQRSQEA